MSRRSLCRLGGGASEDRRVGREGKRERDGVKRRVKEGNDRRILKKGVKEAGNQRGRL